MEKILISVQYNNPVGRCPDRPRVPGHQQQHQ